MISTLFTDIATGLGIIVPAFFGALLEGATTLFFNVGEAGVITLTPVGQLAIVFITLGITYKIAPTVVGWLRLQYKNRKSRKRRAR